MLVSFDPSQYSKIYEGGGSATAPMTPHGSVDPTFSSLISQILVLHFRIFPRERCAALYRSSSQGQVSCTCGTFAGIADYEDHDQGHKMPVPMFFRYERGNLRLLLFLPVSCCARGFAGLGHLGVDCSRITPISGVLFYTPEAYRQYLFRSFLSFLEN